MLCGTWPRRSAKAWLMMAVAPVEAPVLVNRESVSSPFTLDSEG